MSPELRILRLNPRAVIPAYQSAHAAGLDLAACLLEGMPLPVMPGEVVVVPCGIALEIPEGYEGQVRARSGLATRYGITIPNAPGTIDSDYRGELRVALMNLGRDVFRVEHAMRIAQLVIAPVARVRVVEAAMLGTTARGDGGFGSTGLGGARGGAAEA